MAWPKEVPILSEIDIHKGDYDSGWGSHCLLGWSRATFGKQTKEDLRCRGKLSEVVRYLGRKDGDVAGFNDSTCRSIVAVAWNKAMAKLGYVVGNPEAKGVK